MSAAEALSFTAFVVVATVAKLAADPRAAGLVPDDARALAEGFAGAPAGRAARLVAGAPTALLVGALEHLFVPGMAWHYLLRKRWIEAEARDAVAAGALQLLVLGAGYDGLALRLARENPALVAVEIDRPATQERKRAVLAARGERVPANLAFVAADLAVRPLADALAAAPAFRPDRGTIVVVEGVLMYLDEAAVRGLLGALRVALPGGVTLLFGATAEPDAAGDWRRRLADRVLARGGEGTAWARPAAAMADFLAPLGYTLEATVRYGDLQRAHRGPSETRRVPAEDENYYRAVAAPPPREARSTAAVSACRRPPAAERGNPGPSPADVARPR